MKSVITLLQQKEIGKMAFELWEACAKSKNQLNDDISRFVPFTNRFGFLQKFGLFEVPSDDHVSNYGRMSMHSTPVGKKELTTRKDAGSRRGVLPSIKSQLSDISYRKHCPP